MPTPDVPRRLPRAFVGLALPLLLALVAALAACGGSSSAPNIAGTWGGTITEPQMGTNSTLTVADLYLQLSWGDDGTVTGKAALCHGVYGDKPALDVPVRGTVKAPDQVAVQFQQFSLHGTASTRALTLTGIFPVHGTPTYNLAASLRPISASDFAAACAGTGTPTP